MYKSRVLRTWLAKKYLFPLFKELGFKPEQLVIFRVGFAMLTGFSILFLNHPYSMALLTIYQFVFLLDYIDGDLAKHYKNFSLKWNLFDRTAHYLISAFFLFVITASYSFRTQNDLFLNIGIGGSIFLILAMIVEYKWVIEGDRNSLDGLRDTPDKMGILSPVYTFLQIDGSFTFFYFFVILDLIPLTIIFFTTIHLLIFLKKLFILKIKWQMKKK